MLWSQETISLVRGHRVEAFIAKDELDKAPNYLRAQADWHHQTVNDTIKAIESTHNVKINPKHLVRFVEDQLEYNRWRLLVVWDPYNADCHFPELEKTICFPGPAQNRLMMAVKDPKHIMAERPLYKDVWFALDGWDDTKEHWVYKEAN